MSVLHACIPAGPSVEAVELCLPGPGGERRIELGRAGDGWWRGTADGVAAGDPYGLRVHGPWEPGRGVRTNPAKLLVDPWTRRVEGSVTSLAAARAFEGTDPFSARPDDHDSAGSVPHGVVTAPLEPVPGARPGVPWPDTVIYETHVRDLTMRHPAVPEHLRGTYAGLAHPAVIDHLVGLGVTTLELLPVFAHADEPGLLSRGRTNHWGYSTLAYLAPQPRYASTPGREVEEFRAMVATLHAAGLEVVLDVVFNHTCEGGADGPSLSWRGLDAAGWYALDARGRDIDLTGCGNTLDAASPLVRSLVVDSLRHWVTTMGVDGFRFDLASTLGRPRGGGFDPAAPLLTDITSDPVLSTVKLIAEPWDATGEGYQVGGFGPAWAEWNGRFRDDVRDFWRGHGPLSGIVTRIAGSSDLYWPARTPAASVNFVTAHDGFTLADLVSYERKHNEANGEQGRDGTDDNRQRQPRRRGADLRPGDPGAAGPAGAQPAHHAAALGGHPDAPGWRRARPHPARQQQRLLARRRDVLARVGLARSSSTSSPARCPCAAPPRRCGAPTSSTAARTPTPTTPPRTSPGCTPTAASSPSPTSTPTAGRSWSASTRRPRCCSCSTPATPPSTSSCPPPSATPPGPRCSTPARPAAPRPRPTPCPPASPSPSRPTRPWCCGRRRPSNLRIVERSFR